MMHSSHVIILLIVSVVLTLQVHGQSEVSDSRRGLELLFKAPQSISHSTLSVSMPSHYLNFVDIVIKELIAFTALRQLSNCLTILLLVALFLTNNTTTKLTIYLYAGSI